MSLRDLCMDLSFYELLLDSMKISLSQAIRLKLD